MRRERRAAYGDGADDDGARPQLALISWPSYTPNKKYPVYVQGQAPRASQPAPAALDSPKGFFPPFFSPRAIFAAARLHYYGIFAPPLATVT